MDFSSYKTWRNIAIAVIAIIFFIIKLSPSNEDVNSHSNSDSNNLCGTYVEYPNVDRRITRTYVLNSNGSATVTFKNVTDFSNRTETSSDTEYGYWEEGNGYIKVIYDDGDRNAYIDFADRKVYHGYKYYRSRQGGAEFKKAY